ncbi:MAG: hypothetical protein M1830_010377 [Pleopsidium flavum]|nr:MAG: hypothetical protein M1830_010377 [Pleopsidium flavum]
MRASDLLLLSLGLPFTHAAETILGVYIFSRHGDRTPKSLPPANLTDLGYQEIFTSGTYFRDRYISSAASAKIAGINSDLVKQSQITVSAPLDTVLMNSAQGFLQGLYPPVGTTLGSNKLRNGTVVQVPLNGYQLIPVQQVTSGTASEDSAWLQGASNCAKATVSSNEYFQSQDYKDLLRNTADFYKSLAPVINGTFSGDQISYKNAYTIFDLLHVASIHNGTINSSELLTDEVLFQARTLADRHEWGLSYNASDEIRAVAGATLAAQIIQSLNKTMTGRGNSKLNIEFGAYGTFQSFFGLAQLPAVNPDFYGIPDYASTMTFELFTNGPATPSPTTDEVNVRFLFHNGTTSNTSEPVAYPLFGQQQTSLPWKTFIDGMNTFALGSQQQWCSACGNNTGICASSTSPTSASSSPSGTSRSDGITKPVAGVIGAMVTLAVILGIEALVMLFGGLRLVGKKRLTRLAALGESFTTEKA